MTNTTKPEVLLTFVHISDSHITPGDRTEFRPHHYSQRLIAFFQDARAQGVDIGHKMEVPASAANRTLVREINNLPFRLDFILHTGDVQTDPDAPEEYEAAKAIYSEMKYPVYYLRGNHDTSAVGLQRVLQGRSTVTETFDYAFDVNGVQIVCVDSATYGEDHGGHLSKAQLSWLESQCTPDDPRPLVVAIHHPPLQFGIPMLDFFGLSNGEAVHNILKKAVPRLQVVLSGHIHQAVDTMQDGVHYVCVQSPMAQHAVWPAVTMNGAHHAPPNPGFNVVIVTTQRTYIRRYSYVLNGQS